MTAPIRSALIRRSSLPLPIASWHCRTPSSCPQSSWTQCCALVRAMRARARLWRTRCNSVLCSAAKAKRPAEPDLSIALQWLLAVTLRYESALALGLGLVPRTKRDWALCLALSGIRNCPVRPDRVESVHVARAFHRGVCRRGHPQRLAHGGSCGQNHVLKFSDRQEVGNFRKARRAHS
jgi:hypothetical protein